MFMYKLDEIPDQKINKYLSENITNGYELDDLCKSVKGYEKRLLAVFKDYPYRLFANYDEEDKILHFLLVTPEGKIYANYPVKKSQISLVFEHKEWLFSNLYNKMKDLSIIKEKEKFKELLSGAIELNICLNSEVTLLFGYNRFDGVFYTRDIETNDIVDIFTPDEFFDAMDEYSRKK